MKTQIINRGLFFVFFLTAGLASCNNPETVSLDLKGNEDQKEAAFRQILNDEELFNEFMNTMMQETRAMQWMMEDGDFVHHMFNDENLDYMMQHNHRFNSETMRNMMQRYDTSSGMMHQDEGMHHEQPVHGQ